MAAFGFKKQKTFGLFTGVYKNVESPPVVLT
jgi:hypothetical protein